MGDAYVHGYRKSETARLQDQASVLEQLLHEDTAYPAGSTVLEVGCGVGAQTLALARRSPGAQITAIDRSGSSLAEAERRIRSAGLANVLFREADLNARPFAPASFDHLFVCFVLEHLPAPMESLRTLVRLLRPGGTLTVIEGDHASAYFHPDSGDGRAVIAALVELQRRAGGDALIGRRLYPMLREAGCSNVQVTPRLVYVDGARPDLADGFTRRTFTAMVGGVREAAIEAELISPARFNAGVAALERAAEEDGVFCYTFFKARAGAPE